MKWLLDTNVCIRYLNGNSASVMEKLKRLSPDDVILCSVVKAELFYGAQKSQHPTKTLAKQQVFVDQFYSIPFDDHTAEIFGKVRADLASKGTPIGPYDLQIASIALAHDLVLVTHNLREFSRVEGLKIEDWEAEE